MKTKIGFLLVVLGLLITTQNHVVAQTSICAGEEVCLTLSARGTIQWQQSLDAVSFSNVPNGQGDTVCIYPGLSLYFRAVIWEGTCDSVVSDTQHITVFPAVLADAGADIDLCSGGSAAIGGNPTATGGYAPYTYAWSPGAGLSGTTLANPSASPSLTTAYVVSVTDSNGCVAHDTMTVFVASLPIANAGIDVTTNCTTAVAIGGSPTGSGGNGPLTYNWLPSSGLTLPSDANPMALPTTNTTYAVTVTDSLGCSATDSMVLTLTGSSSGMDTVNYSGAPEMWIVPPCVDTLFIRAWGAQGGFVQATPGAQGGYAQGYLPVSTGDTLWFYVGGQGTNGPGGQNCNLIGGWNGGGATGITCCSNAGSGASGGGGATDIRIGGQTLNNRIIVAAGGGGVGSGQTGGVGGGLVGANGGSYASVTATGGTQTAGGLVGGHYTAHTCTIGTDGTFGQGGTGDGNDGGGGGGGWYGGGGGPNNGGGAGGSSYIGGVLNGTTTSGGRTGNGIIYLSW